MLSKELRHRISENNGLIDELQLPFRGVNMSFDSQVNREEKTFDYIPLHFISTSMNIFHTGVSKTDCRDTRILLQR